MSQQLSITFLCINAQVGTFCRGEESGTFYRLGTICRPKNASENMFFYECISGTFCRRGGNGTFCCWDNLSHGEKVWHFVVWDNLSPENAGGTICRRDKMSPSFTKDQNINSMINDHYRTLFAEGCGGEVAYYLIIIFHLPYFHLPRVTWVCVHDGVDVLGPVQ